MTQITIQTIKHSDFRTTENPDELTLENSILPSKQITNSFFQEYSNHYAKALSEKNTPYEMLYTLN